MFLIFLVLGHFFEKYTVLTVNYVYSTCVAGNVGLSMFLINFELCYFVIREFFSKKIIVDRD